LTTEFQPMRERTLQLTQAIEPDAMVEQFAENAKIMQAIAIWVFHQAARALPEPPPEDATINPNGISLKPEKWEEEGLFSGEGMTLAQARELLPGVEEFSLAERGARVGAA